MHFILRCYLAVALSLITLPLTALLAAGNHKQDQILILINQIRREHRLPPLRVSRELTVSAQSYARYMGEANFFGHKGPDGSTCVSRNTRAGYTNWHKLAENLGAGHESPEDMVEAWMKSPSHKANILSEDFREIGVGYAYVKGSYYEHYWVQEFGVRKACRKRTEGKTKRSQSPPQRVYRNRSSTVCQFVSGFPPGGSNPETPANGIVFRCRRVLLNSMPLSIRCFGS